MQLEEKRKDGVKSDWLCNQIRNSYNGFTGNMKFKYIFMKEVASYND